MAKLQLHAVRHIPSQRYMPVAKRCRATIIDLESFVVSKNIRWFDTYGGASRALHAWCKGVWSKQSSYQSPVTNEWDIVGGEPPSVAPEDRKIEEFEIVSFTVKEELVGSSSTSV